MSTESTSSTLDAPTSAFRLPRALLWLGVAVVAWFALSEAVTEAWYRWKESQVVETKPWAIKWPTEKDATERGFVNFQSREMTNREKELLRYDRAESAIWNDASGNQLTVFHLQWSPDVRQNNTDISHNPTICLQAVGLHLERNLPPVDIEIAGEKIRFNCWEFRSGNFPLFAYMAVRRGREFGEIVYSPDRAIKRSEKFEKVINGNRGNPLESIEFIVAGPRTSEAAAKTLQIEAAKLNVSD